MVKKKDYDEQKEPSKIEDNSNEFHDNVQLFSVFCVCVSINNKNKIKKKPKINL